MALDLNSLKRNLQREDSGDWVDFPDWDGVAFNVSSLSLPEYQAAHSRMLKRLVKAYKGQPIPERIMLKETGTLLAEHILHNWRGMIQPYTPEAAQSYLTNPEYSDLIGAVSWCANKIGEVDAKFVEDTAKNSAAPSATS